MIRAVLVALCLTACAADPPPDPTVSDAWRFGLEQRSCVDNYATAEEIDACRLASWEAACKQFGKCPAPKPKTP